MTTGARDGRGAGLLRAARRPRSDVRFPANQSTNTRGSIAVHVKRFEQCGEPDRLTQVLIEAAVDRAHAEVEAVAAGDRNQPHAEQCRICSKVTCRSEPIQIRHLEIEQRGIGLDRFAEFDGFDAVCAWEDFDASVSEHRENRSAEEIVVLGVDESEFTG